MALQLYSQQFWYPDATLMASIPFQVFPDNANTFQALFADAAGTISLPNPGVSSPAGFITFYAAAGPYWLHTDTETFHIDVGLSSEGASQSTGIAYGGIMTVNGGNPAAFDITEAHGFIADYTTDPANPTIIAVTVPAQTVVLSGAALTRQDNWWVANAAGVITALPSQPTPAQRRSSLQLGATAGAIGTGFIFAIQSLPVVLNQPANQFYDLAYGLGSFSQSGNRLSANGANLKFNKSVGRAFAASFGQTFTPGAPHMVNSPSETPVIFRYATRLSSSFGPATTDIDPDNYDVGGVVTPISGDPDTCVAHHVFLFGTGVAGNQVAVQYGQTIYASLVTALAALPTSPYIVNPDYEGTGILVGWIIAMRMATALNNQAQAVFAAAPKFSIS